MNADSHERGRSDRPPTRRGVGCGA